MRIAAIRGDGIGPEVIEQAVRVLRATAELHSIDCRVDEYPYGADHYLSTGVTMPAEHYEQWPKEYTAVLFGAVGDRRVPDNAHAKDIILGMRTRMNLFANCRPVELVHADLCPLKGVMESEIQFTVFRENTEDCYIHSGGVMRMGTADEVAIENAVHTRLGVERIVRAAFEHAAARGCSSVVMSDKSNVMQNAGDLWQRVFREVAAEYPALSPRHLLIDALHAEVLRDPAQFEVIVTSNMFGDILTDMCAQLQGGMGMAASVSYGAHTTGFTGLYEPVHGSAPNIAGRCIANPLGAILCVALMLERHGHTRAASSVFSAVRQTVTDGVRTRDLGGESSTHEVGSAVIDAVTAITRTEGGG